MKYEHPLCEVLWLDAETSFGWEETKNADLEPVLAITVGFLVGQNEHYISIASTYSVDSCNSRIKIPVGMVQTIKELKRTVTKKNPLENPQSEELPLRDEPQRQTTCERKDQKPPETAQ